MERPYAAPAFLIPKKKKKKIVAFAIKCERVFVTNRIFCYRSVKQKTNNGQQYGGQSLAKYQGVLANMGRIIQTHLVTSITILSQILRWHLVTCNVINM